MVALPTGTVTFFFTDIEGSSSLWDADPVGMEQALALHNDIIEAALAEHSGHVIKTMGDGYMAVFADPSDSIRAAVAVQSGLSSAEWLDGGPPMVRIGIHTGLAEPIEGDYHGPDVNRSARIEAAGHGGQILVSAATKELASSCFGDELSAIDLGRHDLRGLERPEQIYQIVAPGLTDTFPPLRTAEAGLARNVPGYRTSFVGRNSERDDIVQSLISGTRLITVVGQGGAGKTRLAVEVIAAAANHFPHGAVFCPLASLAFPDLVVGALIDAIGFAVDTHTSELSPREQMIDYLSSRSMLVVLDNFEDVLSSADLVQELLDAGPGVSVLVTSRERLRVSGESVYPLRGLDRGKAHGGEHAQELFTARALQIDPSLDAVAHAGAIRQVCDLVGGLPLGIELAAAWSGVLSPPEIAEEITAGLDFLEAQDRDANARHRSLRAVFDSSWNRLNPTEQKVLSRLTIFRGGFDRVAAAEVTGSELGTLSSLVAKSLVDRTLPGRFDLHPMIRQFAVEHMSREQQSEVAGLHAAHYLELLARHRAGLDGAEQGDARDALRAEVDNLRAALSWKADHGNMGEIVQLLEPMFLFFLAHSWHEGIEWFAQLGDRVGARGDDGFDAAFVKASVEGTASYLNAWIGNLDQAKASGRAAVRVLEHHEPGIALVLAEAAVGAVDMLRGEHQTAQPLLERAVAGLDPAEHASIYALLCTSLGWSYYDQGDFERAQETFIAGLRAAEQSGASLARAYAISKLGLTADAMGDHLRAIEYHHDGREAFVKLGDPAGEAYTLSRLSWTYWLMEDFEKARDFAVEGLLGFERINHRWGVLATLARLGFAEIGLGELDSAELHFRDLIDRSAAFTMPHMASLYGHTGLAHVAAAQGDQQLAVQVLAGFTVDGSTPQPILDYFVEPALTRIEESMSSDEFAAAVTAGTKDHDGAIAKLLDMDV